MNAFLKMVVIATIILILSGLFGVLIGQTRQEESGNLVQRLDWDASQSTVVYDPDGYINQINMEIHGELIETVNSLYVYMGPIEYLNGEGELVPFRAEPGQAISFLLVSNTDLQEDVLYYQVCEIAGSCDSQVYHTGLIVP